METPQTNKQSKSRSVIGYLKRNPFLSASVAIVWASSFILPFYPTGYGTILSLNVVLWGWGLLSEISSGRFADHNGWAVMIMVSIVNTLFFLIPALPTYLLARKRSLTVASILVLGMVVIYLAFLFFLVPATDGP